MSNNNNTRNIYNKSLNGANDEMELLLNSPKLPQENTENKQMTTINIENDMTAGTSQHHLQRQMHFQESRRDVSATRINMEVNAVNPQTSNGGDNQNIDDRQRLPNLCAMWREARHQLIRSQSHRDSYSPPNAENNNPNTRTWRENLYEVLSSPVSPRAHTQVLRAIFNTSANVRNESSHTNVIFPDEQFYFAIHHPNNNQTEAELHSLRNHRNNGLETQSSSTLRLSRQSSRITDERSFSDNSTSDPETSVADSLTENATAAISNGRRESIAGIAGNSATSSGRQPQRQSSDTGSTTAPTVEMIDDTDANANAVGELIIKLVTNFIRYLPFLFIVFVKFIHDNLLGILDILILHSVVYHINKSLKEQVAKLNQKSFVNLVRDGVLAIFVVSYRIILSSTEPDPFGLLINPPGATIDLSAIQKVEPTKLAAFDIPFNPFTNHETSNYLNSSISVTNGISLGCLLYYVAVNDLILKLLTQIIKITLTMFPTKIIRHKSRARLYALIETVSQFFRALVPIRQWLKYFYEMYAGLEVISGILFSSFYMGAKLFELFERGKPLKKTLVNFMRNMDKDYDRKPTKDELEAAGTVCPICHDNFSSPVILECSHVFCDECVNTWFKREQTCPMCRAIVSEDPTWQDGATTFFYQLF